MKKKIKISVVCASHNGSKKIPQLIKSISRNSILPNEVIICHTSSEDFIFLKKKFYSNFKIKKILSKKKNQIYQRNLAIKNSKNNLILQIDDDVVLKKDFFEKLYLNFKNKNDDKKNIISALILLKPGISQADNWNEIYNKFYLFRLIIFIINNFKNPDNYSVLESGRCIPLIKKKDFKKSNKKIENLQWLCSTICYNKKYVSKYFNKKYQINQKSYYEDVLFTHNLYKNHFKLKIDPNVIGFHKNYEYTNFFTYLRTIQAQLKVVNKFKKSKKLFVLDIIFFSLIHFIRDIFYFLKHLIEKATSVKQF